MTKKRMAIKVVMIGPNMRSNLDNATDGAPSGKTNEKGKGKATLKPKGKAMPKPKILRT